MMTASMPTDPTANDPVSSDPVVSPTSEESSNHPRSQTPSQALMGTVTLELGGLKVQTRNVVVVCVAVFLCVFIVMALVLLPTFLSSM